MLLRVAGIFAVMTLLARSPARSADSDRIAEAQSAMERGVQASQRGDSAAALLEFQAAQKLVPEAPLPHRFAAEALEGLGRFQEAVTEYEEYVRIKRDARDRLLVEKRIEDLVQKHLSGPFELRCLPEGANVSLDGSSMGITPLRPISIRSGEHRLVVSKTGFRDFGLTFRVTAGKTTAVECALRAYSMHENVSPPDVAAVVIPSGARSRPTSGVILGATGLAAIVTGGILGALAISKRSESDRYCIGSECRDPRGVSLNDSARTAARASDIAIGAGLACAAVGTYFLFTDRAKTTASGMSVVPTVGRSEGGFAVTGAW